LSRVKIYYPSFIDAKAGSKREASTYPQSLPKEVPLSGTHLPGSRVVQYHYDVPEEVVDDLAQLASEVGYLGTSESVVIGSLDRNPSSQPNMRPSPHGTAVMRVSYPGFLEELDRVYKANHTARPGQTAKPQIYPLCDEIRMWDHGLWRGPHEVVSIVELVKHRLSPQLSVVLAKTLRDAIMGQVERDGHDVPPLISGHDNKEVFRGDHMAIHPLPEWGRNQSSGDLVGFMITLPRNEPAVRAAIRNALKGLQVKLARNREVKIASVYEDSSRISLSRTAWTGPSRTWASVYPVSLPHRKQTLLQRVEALLAWEGWPALKDLRVGPHSCFSGAPHARHTPPYREFYQQHVYVEFQEPIVGPFMLGVGRYLGTGLMRPWRSN
jgi:CRISPR-associated protein Csb2